MNNFIFNKFYKLKKFLCMSNVDQFDLLKIKYKYNILNTQDFFNDNRKIFDCFIFDNEIELLELRLSEYCESVDYFVIVELGKSHTGSIKNKQNFPFNSSIYKKLKDKIIYEFISYENVPSFNNDVPHGIENFHRNSLQNLLMKRARIGDIIILSDVDEFWNLSKIEIIKKSNQINVFIQNLYYYYLNCKKNQLWAGTISYPFGMLLPQEARNISIDINTRIFSMNAIDIYRMSNTNTDYNINIICDGGSHFSWLKNDYNINEKFLNIYESNIIHSAFLDKNEVVNKFDNGLDFLGRKEWQHKLIFIPADGLCSVPNKLNIVNNKFLKKMVEIPIGKKTLVIVIHDRECEFIRTNIEKLHSVVSNNRNLQLNYVFLTKSFRELKLLNELGIDYNEFRNPYKQMSCIKDIIDNSSADNIIFINSNMYINDNTFNNLIKHHNGYNIPTARAIKSCNCNLSLYDLHYRISSLSDVRVATNQIHDVMRKVSNDSIKYSGNYALFIVTKKCCLESYKYFMKKNKNSLLSQKVHDNLQYYFGNVLSDHLSMNPITVFDSLYYEFDINENKKNR